MNASSQLALKLQSYEIISHIDGIFTELMTVAYPPQTPFYLIKKDWERDMSPLIELYHVGYDENKRTMVNIKRLKTENEVSAYIQSNSRKNN